jgi:tetratricopeptide (TPR) repeat protein
MSLRRLLPQGKIPEEIMGDLNLVFEGEMLMKKERYAAAAFKYQQALENFPTRSAGRFLIYNKLGIAYEKLENCSRAIEVYGKCVAEGSITPFTYHRLADLHFGLGKLKESYEYCKSGIKSLKPAKTDLFQELYFHFIFRKIIWKIKRNLKRNG